MFRWYTLRYILRPSLKCTNMRLYLFVSLQRSIQRYFIHCSGKVTQNWVHSKASETEAMKTKCLLKLIQNFFINWVGGWFYVTTRYAKSKMTVSTLQPYKIYFSFPQMRDPSLNCLRKLHDLYVPYSTQHCIFPL